MEEQLTITSFPVELVHHVLELCHPWDVAAFSRAGRATYGFVYLSDDQFLWRRLYQRYGFDPPYPTHSSPKSKVDVEWKMELQTRMKAELYLLRGPVTLDERIELFHILFTIIEESALAVFHQGSSNNVVWLKRMLKVSLLLNHIYSVSTTPLPEETPIYRLLYPRIRSYLALTLDPKRDRGPMKFISESRNDSRAYVYDLRNYNLANNWGSFMADGSVNWLHVEHLVKVVWTNIRELPGSWALTRPPSCIDSPRILTIPGSSPRDWAGVEGTWRRYVCFMDYRDLFAYNYSDLAGGPYNPQFFADPRFREATRLIEVKLSIISHSQLRFHTHLVWDPMSLRSDASTYYLDQDSPYPPIFFSGTSKGISGNEATVEGCVIMGRDNIPRWNFTSVYEGSPQWGSTGVQIGGVRSAMGVVGVWTTTIHDDDDPVGPFWLWKVETGSPSHLMEYT